ncbi:ABC transporter permease subunit [Marinomonas sp. A79]|uniref:Arginine ABC transporter permease protein ArtM n=1 Tax=Marinomonas vulgaris TaxID=2823372 RepID=A0ABS5HF49_9GAMM|nr:ABC transporter permease subunit [Marinomonas vulgaris]MBR7890162.1 ABC transporter permease subunit [Marinomonas vulgaris]
MLDIIQSHTSTLLNGVILTIKITFISVIIASILSIPLSVLRARSELYFKLPIKAFISFFRGTPLIAQLFLVYYGTGQFRPFLMDIGMWAFFRDPINCALLAFTLNSLAYQTEILRGAIQSVNRGSIEAGRAMGMKSTLLYRRIIMPLAYRLAFPALGNEYILMLKGSAVASVITVMDLMGQTRRVFSQTFDISTYFIAACLYLLITTGFVFFWHQIERIINRHLVYKKISVNHRNSFQTGHS